VLHPGIRVRRAKPRERKEERERDRERQREGRRRRALETGFKFIADIAEYVYLHPADPEHRAYVRGSNSPDNMASRCYLMQLVTAARRAAANKARLFIARRSRGANVNLRVGIFLGTLSQERGREGGGRGAGAGAGESHPMTGSAVRGSCGDARARLLSAFLFSERRFRSRRRIRGFAIHVFR
jgi:hypothetical protein